MYLLMTEFDYPEVTLDGRQNIKIQLLISFPVLLILTKISWILS